MNDITYIKYFFSDASHLSTTRTYGFFCPLINAPFHAAAARFSVRGGKEARFFVRRVVDNHASLLPTFIGIISQCYCAHFSHSTHFIQLGYQICRNNIWEDKRCTFFCQICMCIYIYIYGELLYQFPHHQISTLNFSPLFSK